MGILTGKDIFSAKYITAEITDSEDRIHYVPIKHAIGDYFIADIDGKVYAFSLKNARILIYRQTMVRSFRVIQYDTSHFMSIKPEIKELEIVLEKNGLPKMNRVMHDVFITLSKKEKKNFKEHDLVELANAYAEHSTEYPEQIKNILSFINELDTDKIVTPVRKVTEFIQEDLIATSPSFLGELLPRYQRIDLEQKKISNTPIKGTNAMLKLVVVIMFVAIIGAVGYIAYDQGMFDGISQFGSNLGTIGEGFSGLPSPTAGFAPPPTNAYSDDSIMAKYTPEQLKTAIQNGEVDYNKLSSNMKTMVDSVP